VDKFTPMEDFVGLGLPEDQANTTGRIPLGEPEEIPELSDVGCPEELRVQIETIMDRYPDKDFKDSLHKSASIPALWAVQRHYGWCTPDGIRQAAAVMRVTPAYLESVASFYDLLRLKPVGTSQVLVCTNISCWMRGGDELLDAFCNASGVDRGEAGHGGGLSPDGDIMVSGFECLGACDLAPMASVNERYFGPLEEADAKTVIDQLREGGEVLPEKSLAARPLPGGEEAPENSKTSGLKGPNQ
jgi:NADH-quinone oxidoreductase subunit E